MTLEIEFPNELAPRVEKMIREIEAKASGTRIFKRVADISVFRVRDAATREMTGKAACYIEWACDEDPKYETDALFDMEQTA